MNENKKLRKLHLSLIEQVTVLFDIDLVKSKQLWKEKVDVKEEKILGGIRIINILGFIKKNR